MAASLSAYWVKFFKSAGFPLDVATKHAVVFSNNRIKPDMLPELDKPSLKDMGITLMGDMIAILRYAKKVVEETTCERFLVDTEDDKPQISRNPTVARTIVKKAVATKAPSKVVSSAKPKIIQETILKPAKASPASTVTKATVTKKKILPSTRVVSQVVQESSQIPVKRKLVPEKDETESESEDEWIASPQKRVKLPADDDKIGYTVIMPKGRTIRSQEILKKVTDQKRTVFDRLGDSSVTSTTNLAENQSNPTFNITGLGNDVLKRNSSVFNRLGDKDAKKIERPQTGILKNGATINVSVSPQGILKNRATSIGSTTVTMKKLPIKMTNKATGTMHADHEKSQKTASSSVKQLVRTTKKIRLNDAAPVATKTVRKVANASSKLVSERVGFVPAKARLGLASAGSTKQVTFNRVTKVAHIKKPGVFSRLGI